MADTKISALTAATSLGDTDELVLAVAGANKKITGANLKVAASGWTTVTKTGDESVSSSATLQNDDELFFTTVSGAAYEIEFALVWANGGNFPGMQLAIGEDTSTRGQILFFGISLSSVPATTAIAANQTGNATFGGNSTINRVITGSGGCIGNGGVFRLKWAQYTSDATASILRAGSVLRYRRFV